MNKFLLVALSATSVVAVGVGMSSPSFLVPRQLVKIPCAEEGLADCGQGCIDIGWSCCPSQDRGCPPTSYCVLGSNGEYGCCDNGKICVGEGGASTLRRTETLTNTLTVPGETSTIVQESTTTLQPEESTESTTVVKLTSTTVLTLSDTFTVTYESTTSMETTIKGSLTSATPVPLPTPVSSGGSSMATPIPLPTPVSSGGGGSPAATTTSIAIVSQGAANGYAPGNGIVGGLLAGALALLI